MNAQFKIGDLVGTFHHLKVLSESKLRPDLGIIISMDARKVFDNDHLLEEFFAVQWLNDGIQTYESEDTVGLFSESR